MIWHIVSFDMSGVDDATQIELEQRLAALAQLDVVAWLEVARDVDVPTRTGLLSAFETIADLEAYRHHPEHVPVVDSLRDLGIPVSRVDIEAPLPPTSLR